MPKWIIIIVLTSLILAGCAPSTPDPAVIEQVVRETVSSVPAATAYPTYTPYPTYTSQPSPTMAEPTNTPTPEPNVFEAIAVSKNNVETIEKQGVVFELIRVVVSDRKGDPEKWVSEIPEFDKATTLIMLEFKITNNTDGTIDILLKDHCNILVGKEQVDCNSLPRMKYFNDDIQSIMAGVTRQGGFYVPANTPRSDISKIIFEAPGAFNAKGNGFTGDVVFTFDTTGWTWEPRPTP